MDLNLRPCWAKSLPMPSREKPIRYWKNFAGGQKCRRAPAQSSRVSAVRMNKLALIGRQLCVDTAIRTEGGHDPLRTFRARGHDSADLLRGPNSESRLTRLRR